MTPSVFELKHLRTFVAVAEEAHFGRAAERLHLAQPAVSKRIQDLERSAEVALLERLPRGVRLTAAGRVFLEEARRLLADAERMRSHVRRVAQGEVGSLTIGFNETVSWHGVIPDSVRAFRGRWPEVALTLVPMTSVDQVEALRERRLDAGFLFNRPRDEPLLTGVPVLVDRVMLAVPDGSPWSARPPRRLAELAGEDFVWFPRRVSPAYHDRLVAACRDGGLQLRVVQEGINESTTLGLVAAGLGCTFVPASARWRKPANVAMVPVGDLELSVEMEIVWRRDGEGPALRRFIETATEFARPRG